VHFYRNVYLIPRQEVVDFALFVPVDDGPECGGQVGMGFDAVELAGLDERGDKIIPPKVRGCGRRIFSAA